MPHKTFFQEATKSEIKAKQPINLFENGFHSELVPELLHL